MSHTLFAVFPDLAAARTAMEELEAMGTPRSSCSVVLHHSNLGRIPTGEMPLFETSAAEGAVKGTIGGAVAGAILGGVLALPFGLVGAGFLAAVLFGASSGSVFGLLEGAIIGSSEADPTLAELALALEEGKVLLAVQPPDRESAERAEALLRRSGASFTRRRLLDRERRQLQHLRA